MNWFPEPEPAIEVDAAEVSRKLTAMVKVISASEQVREGLIAARLMTDSETELPFISVISTASADPFLRDAAAVRLCIGYLEGASEVGSCFTQPDSDFMTWSRRFFSSHLIVCKLKESENMTSVIA